MVSGIVPPKSNSIDLGFVASRINDCVSHVQTPTQGVDYHGQTWSVIEGRRGKPDASSDIDLYVINRKPFRQRLQRFFDGVPAEIFVNPEFKIPRYFAQEQRDGRLRIGEKDREGLVDEYYDGLTRAKSFSRTREQLRVDFDCGRILNYAETVCAFLRHEYEFTTWYHANLDGIVEAGSLFLADHGLAKMAHGSDSRGHQR